MPDPHIGFAPLPSNHKLEPGGPEYSRYTWVRDQIQAGSRVLDVGCNCGQLVANLFNDLKCEMVGIDNYPLFIESCQQGKSGKGTFLLADFTAMSDEELDALGLFDVVTALELIEHDLDPDLFLANVWKVLKTDGKFIVTTPHPDGILGYGFMATHPQHVRMWTWETLESWAGTIVARVELYREPDQLYSMGAVFLHPGREHG